MRKICVVTGTRAEYGLLYWLLKEIEADSALQLQLIVTGAHLSPEFGLTYKVIENDGFDIDAKLEMLLSSDTAVGATKSLGIALMGFADIFERLSSDILVILGDRYELLAAAQAALMFGIPIAHISGGEKTEGAIDESIRHALTKLSHYHFVATDEYRKRVIQMGENPQNVINCGDPGIENIFRFPLLSKDELELELPFQFRKVNFLVTYHPVTNERERSVLGMKRLLEALKEFPEAGIIITKGNADIGGRELNDMVDQFAAVYSERVYIAANLGQVRYLSTLAACDVVIGNSSSGIVEAPVLKKATVNIGNRQKGRLRATSIIDCDEEGVVLSIQKALSPEFIKMLSATKSLYGGGNVARVIKEFLKQCEFEKASKKAFYDLPSINEMGEFY